jgi:hypothetical protein
MRLWQIRDDRIDAGLNATLDTGSVMFKILFKIFVPGLIRQVLMSLLSWMWRARRHSTPSHTWPLCLRLHNLNEITA